MIKVYQINTFTLYRVGKKDIMRTTLQTMVYNAITKGDYKRAIQIMTIIDKRYNK